MKFKESAYGVKSSFLKKIKLSWPQFLRILKQKNSFSGINKKIANLKEFNLLYIRIIVFFLIF